MNGILNLYKEKGFTSHDCVAKLRGIFKQKKIGHMGTLDPAAEGVLPVALGKATRLIELFSDDRKTYRTVMLLGTVTDTLDLEGKVLGTHEVCCSEEEVRSAVMSFLGDHMQVPPMYSAIKKDGKKLYELAREGKTIEREPRPVKIFDIHIEHTDLPETVFTVECSKGTYIRSLCDDIGAKLGCGACMKYLERIKVGSFIKENAFTLGDLEKMAAEGRLEETVLPIEALFPELEKIRTLEGAGDKAAHNGNQIEAKLLNISEAPKGRFWLYDSEDNIIGIYEYKKGRYFPVKMVFEN